MTQTKEWTDKYFIKKCCQKAKEEVYREIERLDDGLYDLKGVQDWIRKKKLKTKKDE